MSGAEPPFILASASASRRHLLAAAGLAFGSEAARIDERSVEAPLMEAGAGPGEVALHLAEAKARDVASRRPGRLVLGADQTLGLGTKRFDKAPDLAAARAHLEELAGRTHELHSALVLVRDETVEWRHVSVARMTMRPLGAAFLDAYVEAEGEALTASVGCYRLEGPGIQLFEAIEGDYFTILGLPLLPLLAELRRRGVVAA